MTVGAGDMSMRECSDNLTYRGGIARVDITPPRGIRLVGYTVREGFCLGTDEPLTATVLVLQSGGSAVAIIAMDWCAVYPRFMSELRRRCARALKIPSSHVLINASHTHCAPVPPDFMPYDSPEQVQAVAEHADTVARLLERACRKAVRNPELVRIAAGWGECLGNINRRQPMPDGGVLLGENPGGFCDSSVGVVRLDRMDGRPLAVLFRYSCHPVTMGPRIKLASPDYPGPARRVIERAMECPSLFLQGCGGNLNPRTGIGSDSSGREDCERLGYMLGAEVVRVCSSLRTHRARKAPRLVRSVAVYWLFEYESIAPGGEGPIRAAETMLELPLEPFPPLQEVRAERALWAERLEAARQRGAPESEILVARRLDYWAQVRLDAASRGPNPATIRFPVQVVEFGSVAIVAAPFELMAETGEALRRESPQPFTLVTGYSNGVISYLPTAGISREGGMESKSAYKYDLVPSEIPGDWEAALRATAISLLRRPG